MSRRPVELMCALLRREKRFQGDVCSTALPSGHEATVKTISQAMAIITELGGASTRAQALEILARAPRLVDVRREAREEVADLLHRRTARALD